MHLGPALWHFLQMLWTLLDPSLYKTYNILKKITDTTTGFFYIPRPVSSCWLTPRLKAFKSHIGSDPNWEKPQKTDLTVAPVFRFFTLYMWIGYHVQTGTRRDLSHCLPDLIMFCTYKCDRKDNLCHLLGKMSDASTGNLFSLYL